MFDPDGAATPLLEDFFSSPTLDDSRAWQTGEVVDDDRVEEAFAASGGARPYRELSPSTASTCAADTIATGAAWKQQRPRATLTFDQATTGHVARATPAERGSSMEAGTTSHVRRGSGDNLRIRRLSTETKHSTKTTEFYAMILIIAGS